MERSEIFQNAFLNFSVPLQLIMLSLLDEIANERESSVNRQTLSDTKQLDPRLQSWTFRDIYEQPFRPVFA